MLKILLGNRCCAHDIEALLTKLKATSQDTYTLFSPHSFEGFPQICAHTSTQCYDFIYLPDAAQAKEAQATQIPYFAGSLEVSLPKRVVRACKHFAYACIESSAKLSTRPTQKRELAIIRTDAIGDYLLFRNFLPLFAKYYGRITLIGNATYADLVLEFDRSYIQEFIPICVSKFRTNPIYRFKILRYLRSLSFEVLINPIFSRDYLSESLARFLHAQTKIASIGDSSNLPARFKARFDSSYHRLLPASPKILFEFYRNAEFARTLLPTAPLPPYALTLPHSHIREFELPARYVVFFIGASTQARKWSLEHFYEVGVWHMENGFSVVICGGKEDYEGGERLAHNLTQAALQKGLDTKALSLCGSTSLSALARVVYNGNHLLSNETSCVHIACAIRHDISIYVVSNGNHLYRFTPYPQGIGGKYYGIYHPTIDKNLAAYGIISNFLQEASRLDINHISPQAVIRIIESTLASEVSESILLIGGGAAQKLNSKIRHSALRDKSWSLIVSFGHYRLGNSLASNLHNHDLSSQILECQASKPESNANLESKTYLDSLDSVVALDSVFPSNSTPSSPGILVSCARFKCFSRRGEGSLLGVSERAEPQKSFKDCARDEFLDCEAA